MPAYGRPSANRRPDGRPLQKPWRVRSGSSLPGLRNRAGNPIALSRLADLLKDKIYLGKVVWHGVEYDGIHEPLQDLRRCQEAKIVSGYTCAPSKHCPRRTCDEKVSRQA